MIGRVGKSLPAIGSDMHRPLRDHGIEARLLSSPPRNFPMWLIDVAKCRQDLPESWLSDAERERSVRFKSAPLRQRYIAAHIGLHVLLCDLYGMSERDMVIERNEFGKPHLKLFPKLHYSLSYSANYVLIGLNEGDEIGVDVEAVRPIPDAMELARAHFTRDERLEICSAGSSCAERSRTFLKIWVRKEAAVKAFGCGLSIPLTDVECGGGDGEVTVRLSESLHCKTGIVQFGGDPIVALARSANSE